MTAQRDKLESVLAEIDAILGESGPRLPWVMSNDVQQQRQILAKVRDLLAELRQTQAESPQSASQELASHASGEAGVVEPTAAASSQVLRALLQEMQYLRGQTMQILDPLRSEVATLKQQRELLLKEVQQLQQQRLQLDEGTSPGLSAGQWEEMLEQLTNHLEAQLHQHIQQSVKRLETTTANTYLLTQGEDEESKGAGELTPVQRLEYLKQIQSQSDQLVMNLDRVLRTVFDSLQQSIYSYQDSLSHGLNKMHTLGQQGEMMFNALINHLAQQMSQETLAYLEASPSGTSQPRQLPDAIQDQSAPKNPAPVGPAPPPPTVGTGLDLDAMDLDLALNDDEVTLLQVDDEISQLQYDIEALAEAYDPTRSPAIQPEGAKSLRTPPSEAEQVPSETLDPLEVLDQLDEAAPRPDPSVSLPERPRTDTLEANSVTGSLEEDSVHTLDDLYQSIFGGVLDNSLNAASPVEQVGSEQVDVSAVPGTANQVDFSPGQGTFAEAAADSEPSVASWARPEEEVLVQSDSAELETEDFIDRPDELGLDSDTLNSMLEVVEEAPEEDAVSEGVSSENQMFVSEASLDELFGDGTVEQLTEAGTRSSDFNPPEDTIHSLADLLPASQPTLGSPASGFTERSGEDPLSGKEGDSPTGEEEFITAAEDEDLLASDDLPQANHYWLQVDQRMVDQLNEDLFDLEAGTTPDLPPIEPPVSIEESFAGFEEDPWTAAPAKAEPTEPAAPIEESFTSVGADSSPPLSPEPTEPVQESSAQFPGRGELDSPAQETVENTFAAFGEESPEQRFAADLLAEQPPDGSSEPTTLSDNHLWQSEAHALIEDNRMSTGDLPSQAEVAALLADLNLSLEPDGPPVGESGLTLDALDSLASPPPAQAGEQNPAVGELNPETPTSVTPKPQEQTPPAMPTAGNQPANDLDLSLTLENLLGELKLDPLFPNPTEAPSQPLVTTENLFGDNSSSPNENFPESSTPMGEAPSISPAPTPEDTRQEGTDLFDQSFSSSSTSEEPHRERLNLFGDVPPAEPLSGDVPEGGIDLFGEIPPAEPTPAASPEGGIDLFGEPSPPEPGPPPSRAEGIDLFGDIPPDEPSFREFRDSGIDGVGEPLSPAPGPVESQEKGIDLFGDIPSSVPAWTEEETRAADSTSRIDLFPLEDDRPPITLEDLDLTLGDGTEAAQTPDPGSQGSDAPTLAEGIVASSSASETPDQDSPSRPVDRPAMTEDLFSDALGEDGLESSPSERPKTAADLFGDTPDEGRREMPPTTLPETAEDLFSDAQHEQPAASAEGNWPAEQSAPEPSESPTPTTPEAESFAEVKYTEWLSDISLENILGTAKVEPVAPPGDETFQETTGESSVGLEIGSDSDTSTALERDLATPIDEIEEAVRPSDDEAELSYPEQSSDDFGLEDLLASPPESTESDSTPVFDLPHEDSSAASGPMGSLSEQDFLNLDSLLDEGLETGSEAEVISESERFEDSSELTQNFESEVEFIDLDALLEEPLDGESLDEAPLDEVLSDGEEVSPRLVEISSASLNQETLPDLPTPEDLPAEAQAEEELFGSPSGLESQRSHSVEQICLGADQDMAGEEAQGDAEASSYVPRSDEEADPCAAESLEAADTAEEVLGASALASDVAAMARADAEPVVVNPTKDLNPPTEDLTAVPITVPDQAEELAQGDERFATAMPEPPQPEVASDPFSEVWCLGLDIGAQGISAVLLQRHSGRVFPLYWVDTTISGATADKFFRLPTIASVDLAAEGYPVQSVGSAALMVNWEDSNGPETEDRTVLLKSLKPFLKMGMPMVPGERAEPQPMIQWSDQVQLPLQIFETALQRLLTTLLQPTAVNFPLTIGAVGLEAEDIAAALQQLQGVVVSYPANWPDTYPFNVREAVVSAGLVKRPDDVYFVEDAIAAVLSGLPDPAEPHPSSNGQPVQQQTLYACHWSGGTVVISAGATVTEMGLANLPEALGNLSYQDFALHSMSYAGDAIDLDIICHLLHPPERRKPRDPSRYRGPSNTDGWSWQAAMPELEAAHWDELDLDSLDFPRPAEPDLSHRFRLQQRLESSLLGQSLLEAVRHLKIILQHQPQFELELADQRWLVRSKDLEDRIILPYIQRINGHLNRLVSEVGLNTQAINQVICTGGSASLPKISRWLRQKFPNATIIQDTYHSDRPPSCSRVAYGLVNLLRYPQVLDLNRHQYSDMFLLMELLRTFPDQPMPLSGILHLLKERGINTDACELHLIALLEGHLPPGLLPAVNNPFVQIQASEDADLQALLTTPLFSRPNNQVYVPNPEQCQRLRTYMEVLLSDKHQNLLDPLLARLTAITA